MIKLFFKFNILLFSFLILSITNLYSEIIKDFKIIGNDRVNSETIKVFSGVSIGDNLTTDDLNIILKNLFETNFFKNINLKYENSILSINVVENPIVQNLIIQGKIHERFVRSHSNTCTFCFYFNLANNTNFILKHINV